jgi:nucleotide-binding universal stress UspA family protein
MPSSPFRRWTFWSEWTVPTTAGRLSRLRSPLHRNTTHRFGSWAPTTYRWFRIVMDRPSPMIATAASVGRHWNCSLRMPRRPGVRASTPLPRPSKEMRERSWPRPTATRSWRSSANAAATGWRVDCWAQRQVLLLRFRIVLPSWFHWSSQSLEKTNRYKTTLAEQPRPPMEVAASGAKSFCRNRSGTFRTAGLGGRSARRRTQRSPARLLSAVADDAGASGQHASNEHSETHRAFADHLKQLAETIKDQHNELTARLQLEEGSAAAAPTETAGTAALVVVGPPGRGGLARLLLGSASRSVLDQAKSPVLVVPNRVGSQRD